MPPSIPTHRPLMTATRGAVLVALLAVVCSVFLAVDSAYSRAATAPLASSDRACADLEARPAARDRLAGAGDRSAPVR